MQLVGRRSAAASPQAMLGPQLKRGRCAPSSAASGGSREGKRPRAASPSAGRGGPGAEAEAALGLALAAGGAGGGAAPPGLGPAKAAEQQPPPPPGRPWGRPSEEEARQAEGLSLDPLAWAEQMLAEALPLHMCWCGAPRERCHPGEPMLRADQSAPWDLSSFTRHFPEIEEHFYLKPRKIFQECLSALGALLSVRGDFSGALRYFCAQLQGVESLLRRPGFSWQTKGPIAACREVARLASLFELLSDLLVQELGQEVGSKARVLFYRDLREQVPLGVPLSLLRGLGASLEAAVIESLHGAGLGDLARERWKDRLGPPEADEVRGNPHWLSLMLHGAVLPQAQVLRLAQCAAALSIAHEEPPAAAEIRELVRLCWQAGRPWQAAAVVLRLASAFRATLEIQERSVALLHVLWQGAAAACSTVDTGPAQLGRRTARGRKFAQRLRSWAGGWLDHEAMWFFRAGADTTALRSLLPQRVLWAGGWALEGASESPLSIVAQLECCAERIERSPLDTGAWCSLSDVLCDSRGARTGELAAAVEEVWAPRRSLWLRLLAPRLPMAPACVLRGLALLLGHWPGQWGCEPWGLLREPPTAGSQEQLVPACEVPLEVSERALRQALSSRTDGQQLSVQHAALIERLFLGSIEGAVTEEAGMTSFAHM